MSDSLDSRIAAVAACQQGVISRRQIMELGGTNRQVHRRLTSGALIQTERGVYRLPGVPGSWHQRLWETLLAVGVDAAVSHEAAAALHAIPGFANEPVVVTVAHGTHPRPEGATVHAIDDLTWGPWVSPIDGMPVTVPARTVVDLAATCRMGRLAAAVDDAVAAKLVTINDIGRVLQQVARRGKPGMAMLALLLDERGPGWVPAESTLERKIFKALRAAGEPLPVLQFPFPGRLPGPGRVDAAYVPERLILEVDGRRWHTRVADLARDHRRDAEAARAGWLTLRILYEHFRDDERGMVGLIHDTRISRARFVA